MFDFLQQGPSLDDEQRLQFFPVTDVVADPAIIELLTKHEELCDRHRSLMDECRALLAEANAIRTRAFTVLRQGTALARCNQMKYLRDEQGRFIAVGWNQADEYEYRRKMTAIKGEP